MRQCFPTLSEELFAPAPAYLNEGDQVWVPRVLFGSLSAVRCTVVSVFGDAARVTNEERGIVEEFYGIHDIYVRKAASS